MFDPVYAAFDFIYGDRDGSDPTDAGETMGWYAALALGMKMDMFTPELFFASMPPAAMRTMSCL
jgi:hypothetical protein